MNLLKAEQWQPIAQTHRTKAEEWTIPYRSRRAQSKMHPVFDFLFIYYRFAPAQLEYWHPGIGVALETEEWLPGYNQKSYSLDKDRIYLDTVKLDAKVRKRLQWSLDLCKSVRSRPAQFACFGMHEWAMVYQGGPEGRARHEGTLPLRLTQSEIDTVVESRPICCSHFDAFRFFTDTAIPMNRFQPNQEGRMLNEQPGCLHTNMDLYKWTAKCMPWVGTELLWDTFNYAISCREVDMRASPYDCSQLGYTPIQIETSEGRAEYEIEQAQLAKRSKKLRDQLIEKLESLLQSE
ncbi:MAG TPA: 3-methyladenine DNA glycosylase [Opitutae bacterium]|nr:3-methyladenine DNA glycosylase [Opitutae bacterium]